jgi:hypothetical protein
MSIFGNIFENPALKNAAFGQLKKLIKSENLGLIVVRLNPDTDELEIDMYKPGEAVITVEQVITAPEENQFLIPEKTTPDADNQNS